MPAGLNRWPAANLRFRRRTERLLEPLRDRGMKSQGLHGRQNGTKNLRADGERKSYTGFRPVGSEGILPAGLVQLRQARTSASPRDKMSVLRVRAQSDYFAQHTDTVPKKTDFAALSMVPADRNLADTQAGAMRQIKQLHIECEAVDPRHFKNLSRRVETKRFKAALRVPERQPRRNSHKQIENATS